MSKATFPALLLVTLVLAAGLIGSFCPAQPADEDNAAVINRLIDVIANPQANRDQRINATLTVSKDEYKNQAGRAIPAMVGLLDELIQEQAPSPYPFATTANGVDKVALALGDMGPQAVQAVPGLVFMLQCRSLESYKRQAAATALGKIGSQRAVSALVEAAHQDKYPEVRRVVAAALKQLALTNKQAALELKVIAQIDPDESVRIEAGAPKPEKKEGDTKEGDKAPEKLLPPAPKGEKPADKKDEKPADNKGDKPPE